MVIDRELSMESHRYISIDSYSDRGVAIVLVNQAIGFGGNGWWTMVLRAPTPYPLLFVVVWQQLEQLENGGAKTGAAVPCRTRERVPPNP